MTPLLAALLLAASPPSALTAVAGQLGQEVGPPADGRRGLLVKVETRAPALTAPLEAALSEALSRQGYAVVPAPAGADAEAAARQSGQDWLLRVQAGLVPGRREVALVGEVIPAWESFFLQRRPGARARPPRLVQARAPADPETLLLGREARPPGAPFARVRPFASIPGRVLALAIGDAGEGLAVAAATPEAVLLLAPDGAVVARREPDRAGWAPVRDASAALAIGDFGGGRLAVQWAGAPRAEVLARHGDRLEVVGGFAAAPLCAGDAGRLFGQYAPGTSLFQDLLAPAVDAGTRPRSDRLLYGVAAAPHGGPIASGVLGTDLRVELLGPDLSPAAPGPAQGDRRIATGVGFALADLDGAGTAEVVASLPTAGGQDQLRVLAPGAARPVLFESEPFAGAFLAGAGGDVTGDGVDDALLALVVPVEDGWRTDLLLVTSDPRELP